jgi:hypothetical protein
MTFKLLRNVLIAGTCLLGAVWVNAARPADLLTLAGNATVLAVLLVADKFRQRPGRSRFLVECATAMLIAFFLVWISRGGPRPLY